MESSSPFAGLLVEQRKRKGWSRSQLSEQSGLSYPYISQLETSQRKPSRKAAAQLALALDVDPAYLESAIPADESDPRQVERARSFTSQLLASAPIQTDLMAASSGAARGTTPSREDTIGDMLDLLEEFEVDERPQVLAELQRRAMERMLGERRSR